MSYPGREIEEKSDRGGFLRQGGNGVDGAIGFSRRRGSTNDENYFSKVKKR